MAGYQLNIAKGNTQLKMSRLILSKGHYKTMASNNKTMTSNNSMEKLNFQNLNGSDDGPPSSSNDAISHSLLKTPRTI